jgi:predicted dehydrogenase
MSRHSRRDFLKRAAAGGVAAAAFTISGTRASGRVLGANDRIRIAVAGINGRGMAHLEAYCAMKKDVEIAYLVDPDSRVFPSRSKFVQEHAGNRPKCLADLRKVLDDKDLDAVSIAAPNHWHSLLAIWAIQAGKDVYVEKPCSHNVFEGRKLVEAARKYDRIVQHGTQSRSSLSFIAETAAVRSGKYGKLLIAYGWASKTRRSIGFKETAQPPKEVDFDIWLGPAPEQPYHANLVPYNWHWFWDFGNGEIGNQGVHQMDIARWAMPDGAAPRSVISLGGRFGYKDQGQTPNTQLSIIDFGEAKLIFEDRGLVNAKTTKVANEFYTTEGVIKNGRFFGKGKTKGEPLPKVAAEALRHNVNLAGTPNDPPARPQFVEPHFVNFIDCVRSRKRENLHAEILEGHLSSLLSHLANISYRLGADVPFSQEMKSFGDDKAAYKAFDSMKEHLADAAKLKLDDSTYRLGRTLAFDATAERFVGDDEANKLLTRAYRAPYVVPESV